MLVLGIDQRARQLTVALRDQHGGMIPPLLFGLTNNAFGDILTAVDNQRFGATTTSREHRWARCG